MPTLELTIQRQTDSGYPVAASLTRPGGFLPLRREGTLTLDPADLDELQYDPLAYGTALGQTLFVDEIRDTFREGLAGGEPLRVLLSIEAPDLRAIDWHRLAAPFDGHWRFLASQQNTPFSLSIPSPASAHFPALGRRDLRALVLVAGPETLSGDYKLASFDVPATLAGIQESLGDIPCDVLQNPSLDALCAALTQTPYTFLHLVCHGAVKKETGETILFFPKDSQGSPTTASELLNRLSSLARLPHFAFVAACESALPHNGLGSLAGRLVRELGLPAVLAMTDRVSIATANAITAPFYTHLYQHGQPDLALAQSLAGLQGAHDLTVPAIFSRLGDRPLFDDNAERALTDKELEFGLVKLAELIPERAPVLTAHLDTLIRRLRSTLGADSKSLSESSRTERKETLDGLNSLSLEALDLSFNALCLGQTPPTYDSRSPFRGLESFRPEDAANFFGREALTRKLVQKLNEHNFLAVLGASGSGKSSLVMAGLIPALNVPYAVFRPGAEPLAELEKALQSLPSPTGRGAGGEGLLVIDQFEELFTLSAREQRPEFISRLLEQSGRLRVVITLRADFLGEVAPFKSLKDEVQNHQEIIPPMDEAELRRSMEAQAACAGLRFESDLSQQMLDDVSGEPGAMPLLQHALWTLWTRRHGRWLRADEYRAFGGVKQAIASTAEAVFARCTDFEKERLRDIFLRLTRLDDSADGRDTRRRVLLRDLIPADSEPAATTLLIKQLADARLVVITGDEVEVAHEALIRHWERLRAWLDDDRDNLRLREGISDDARRWENANRDESLLNHRGPRLELALAMSKNPRYQLNPVEQAYLDGCVALREKRVKEKETARRRAMNGLATGLIIALVLVGFSIFQMQKSQKQSQIALARGLASQSALLITTGKSNQLLSVLLAIQSMKIEQTVDASQTIQNNNLASIFANYEYLLPARISAEYPVFDAGHTTIFDSNGNGAVLIEFKNDTSVSHIVQLDNQIGLPFVSVTPDEINLSPNKIIATLDEASFMVVAMTPDQKYMAAGSSDNTVSLWEVFSGTRIITMAHKPWGEYAYSITSIDISPDGKYIVSISTDKTIRVWDTKSGQEIVRKSFEDEPKINVAKFSPDGNYIASGGDDSDIHVWETTTGNDTFVYSASDSVTSIDFSPDGKLIVVGEGETASILKLDEQALLRWFFHDDEVLSVNFSPDGSFIATGSRDNTARLFNIKTGEEVAMATHSNDVVFAGFLDSESPQIISQSVDGNVQVWGRGNVRFLKGYHDATVESITFNSSGTNLVSASYDGTIKIWDLASGNETMSIQLDEGGSFVKYSPDGKYILVGDLLNIVHLIDTQTGDEIFQIADDGEFNGVIAEFSPDGKYLVFASVNSSIQVFELESKARIYRQDDDETIRQIVFSPNGQFLAASGENIFIWTNGFKDIKKISGQEFLGWNTLAFSPDSKFIAAESSNAIHIWNAETQEEIINFSHDEYVTTLVFSADGKYIASGSFDNTARVWDIRTGEEISRVNVAFVQSVAES